MSGATKQIGENIKELRKRAKLTQSQIAEVLEVDRSMIAKIEAGERKITADMLEQIGNLFCTPVDKILEGGEASPIYTVAFRQTTIESTDLRELININKIILNQLQMDKLNRKDV